MLTCEDIDVFLNEENRYQLGLDGSTIILFKPEVICKEPNNCTETTDSFTSVPIPSECCNVDILGQKLAILLDPNIKPGIPFSIPNIYFDIEDQKCKYGEENRRCAIDEPFKLVLNPVLDDGVQFETFGEECELVIDFDYIFKYKCSDLQNLGKIGNTSDCKKPIDVFETLDVSFTLDIVNQSSQVTIYEDNFFPAIGQGNLYTYLSGRSDNTGFLICNNSDNNTPCNPFSLNPTSFTSTGQNIRDFCISARNRLRDDLANQALEIGLSEASISGTSISNDAFNTNWLHYTTTINDPVIIDQLLNQKIVITIEINYTCIDLCVLLDNIKINKKCKDIDRTEILLTKSPGFEIEKIVDNKKSWVNTENDRNFDLSLRLTDYDIIDYRQVLNTKEIDLDLDIASAVENDVICYITSNDCILTGTTITPECSLSGCGDNGTINFDGLLTTEFSAATTIEMLKNILSGELIDAKNRKTITSYATLKALYDRYLNSLDFCSGSSSNYTYYTIEEFANLIDNYWVDLIEQVVPSTTIWGSTKVYRNTIFDDQKFQYKKYTLFFKESPYVDTNVLSPVNAFEAGIDVNIENITNNDTSNIEDVLAIQMNSGSEFWGGINILNLEEKNSTNNNITILNSD